MKRRELFVPLATSFIRNARVLKAGEKAEVLYVRALCLAKDLLSDGALTDEQLRTLGLNGLQARAKRLVEVGLWERVEGGYRVAGWLERNPTSDEVEGEKRAHAEKMRRWRSDTRDDDVTRHKRTTTPSRDAGVTPVWSPGDSFVTDTELEKELEIEKEPPPPLSSRESLGASANGAGLTAGEEEDSEERSRSKAETTGRTDSAEQHLRRTCLVIAARRFVTRPPESEPIRRPELWQSEVAREAVERFRAEHHSIFSDSVSLKGQPPTEQETADVLEPPAALTGMAAIDATALDDP